MPSTSSETPALATAGNFVVPGTSPNVSLLRHAQLQQQLRQAIHDEGSRDEVITRLLRILAENIPITALLYCRPDARNEFAAVASLSPAGTANLQTEFQEKLLNCCVAASQTGALQAATLDSKGRLLALAAPVFLRKAPTEAVGVIALSASADAEKVSDLLRLIASHVSLKKALDDSQRAESESISSAALIELLSKVDAALDPQQASVILVNELREFLRCQQVVVGLKGLGGVDCQLTAVSGLSKFDKRSEFTAAMEAALDEAILKNVVTVWPTSDDVGRTATLAHKRACEVAGASAVISSPLHDERGSVIGAWLFFGNPESHLTDQARRFVHSSQRRVGSRLELLQRASENPWKRQLRHIWRGVQSSRMKCAVLAGCLLLGLMLLPVHYKVWCRCQVQPVVRRYVAAPYDGKLEKTFVEPGDEVHANDLVAKLDGRELRYELAGFEAEFGGAKKSRDSAMAVDSIAEAQQAAFEMERLKLKIDLILNRLDNLEIRSPLTGIIISGDLRKAEGVPLTVGQTMFEIAPLNRMIVEVEIPEREILYVHDGQTVEFQLEAYPYEKWSGEITRIFPKSEIRETDSVYVAEVDLDNRSAELRPGMKGRAKILADRHPLGWNLFHRPFESFLIFVGR